MPHVKKNEQRNVNEKEKKDKVMLTVQREKHKSTSRSYAKRKILSDPSTFQVKNV